MQYAQNTKIKILFLYKKADPPQENRQVSLAFLFPNSYISLVIVMPEFQYRMIFRLTLGIIIPGRVVDTIVPERYINAVIVIGRSAIVDSLLIVAQQKSTLVYILYAFW